MITWFTPISREGLADGSNPNGYQKAGQLEAAPTGSRVLSILDAFVDMAAYLGTNGSLVPVTPGGSGTTLDLHYLMGRTEPRGTYVEWDRSSYPEGQAIDPNRKLFLNLNPLKKLFFWQFPKLSVPQDCPNSLVLYYLHS